MSVTLESVIDHDKPIYEIVNTEARKGNVAMIRICPFCHRRTLRKYDIYRYKGIEKQRYICEHCGRITANPHYKKVQQC